MRIELLEGHLVAMPTPRERVFTEIEALIDLMALSAEGRPLSTSELGVRWSWDGPSVVNALQRHVDILNIGLYDKLSSEKSNGEVPTNEGA